jgi:ABC-type polysaccharide/polyol phosphate export permease
MPRARRLLRRRPRGVRALSDVVARARPDPVSEIWRERRLLGVLVLRDVRTRYAGSSVGLLWAVANPLLQIVILTLVFSYVLEIRLRLPANAPFPIVLAWGLFPWIGLQDGLARATTAIVDGGILIKRMSFRPGILIAQTVFAAALQQAIALGILALAMPLAGVAVGPGLLLCLLPFAVQVCLMIGVGWILGEFQVYLRDTAQVVVAALQAWFYLTPIVYTLETAPETLQRLLLINPLCGIIETYRAFALGGPVPWAAFAWSTVAAVAAVLAGGRVLSRARDEIADLV